MEVVRFEEVAVDRCTACHGLWFDRSEDEKLRYRRGAEVIDDGDARVGKKNNDVRDAKCPKCSVRMIRMVDAEQPHIWYESCGSCGGVYFDAGEFRDLRSVTIFDKLRDWFSKARE